MEKRASIAEEQEEFIQDFNELGDWMMQYDCLLELTTQLRPMADDEKNEQTRIAGCQAKLWVTMSYDAGKVYVGADSDALIVKGIVAVIVALLNERTPEEIVNTPIDFLEKTPLKMEISTDRFQGMTQVISKIKFFAKQYL